MISSEFTHLRITGMSSAVPTRKVDAVDYEPLFGAETVQRNISMTGVHSTYHASPEQISSDFGFVAAKNLLERMAIDPASIDVIIFTAAYLDYFVPPTACVLHYRLGLSQNCIAFDTNLACSGYVYGLQTLCSTLHASSAKRGLLVTGDMTSKVVSPQDKSRMLFGDGGTATLVEKCVEEQTPLRFGMKTDGSRFKDIIVPAGAFRNVGASRERTCWGDGNTRSDYDLFMNGTDVFNFSMRDVPRMVPEFLERFGEKTTDFDNYIFHQPNLFILRHLIKKIGVSEDKMLISLDRYGNTSVCSIPLTICDHYGDKQLKNQKLFLYGFGVGLSWAIASVTLDTEYVLPITHTDDYFTEGSVDHGLVSL